MLLGWEVEASCDWTSLGNLNKSSRFAFQAVGLDTKSLKIKVPKPTVKSCFYMLMCDLLQFHDLMYNQLQQEIFLLERYFYF